MAGPMKLNARITSLRLPTGVDGEARPVLSDDVLDGKAPLACRLLDPSDHRRATAAAAAIELDRVIHVRREAMRVAGLAEIPERAELVVTPNHGEAYTGRVVRFREMNVHSLAYTGGGNVIELMLGKRVDS